MSPRLVAGRALLVALALAPAAAAGAGSAPPRVALLTTSTAGSDARAAAVALAVASAARETGAEPLSPDEVLRAAPGARDAVACGKNAGCAAATCAAVGADALLAATIDDTGSIWVLEMRLRDGKRGSLKAGAAEAVARDERLLADAAARIAARLMGPLVAAGVPPLAASPSPAAGGHPPPAPEALAAAPHAAAAPVPPPAAVAAAAPPIAPPAAPPRAEASRAEPEPEGAAPRSAPPAPAPPPPAADASRAELEREASAPGRTSRHRWGMALLGSGAALLAGGAAAGGAAWLDASEARSSLGAGNLGGWAANRNSARTLAWAGAALGGAGAVALAAGAWLRLGGRSSQVSLAPGPGAAGASIAIAF